MSDHEQIPPGVDPSRPSPARMYDRFLGGTANFRADRDAADEILRLVPEIRDAAWANRGFLLRAVRWMADRGIRQFIDLGAGLPAQRSTHEVARQLAPDARVLYTDNDPGVIAYGRHLLAGVPGVGLIEADFRDPEALFGHPLTRELIDFTQPAGLLIVAVAHFIPDADDPWGLVARYVNALAPGSYLALSAAGSGQIATEKAERIAAIYARSTTPAAIGRSKADIARFFDGLRIVTPYPDALAREPVFVAQWDSEDPAEGDDAGSRMSYAAVARKPGGPQRPVSAKPTADELGIDVTEVAWRRSAEGPGTLEVAFTTAKGEDWVLMRAVADPAGRVSVFTRFEWYCFLDGAKNGEFDHAADDSK
jgi:S-adenosyl methyltransferase